jgi:hypothetical protein
MSRLPLGVGLSCLIAALVGPGLGGRAAAPAPAPREEEKAKADNSNALLKEYKGKLKVTASTSWPGWAPEKVIDGDPQSSWFTAGGDAAAKGTKPWVQIELPGDETVSRVTVLGNREPAWPTGFSVLSGSLELLDKDGKRLWYKEDDGAGDLHDFDFRPKEPVKGVRFLRFTSLGDQGDKNGYDDIAVAEIQAE